MRELHGAATRSRSAIVVGHETATTATAVGVAPAGPGRIAPVAAVVPRLTPRPPER